MCHVNIGGPRGTPDDERRTAVDRAVDLAVGLGASLVRLAEERGERWAVMQDPEGNEFCGCPGVPPVPPERRRTAPI